MPIIDFSIPNCKLIKHSNNSLQKVNGMFNQNQKMHFYKKIFKMKFTTFAHQISTISIMQYQYSYYNNSRSTFLLDIEDGSKIT